MSSSSETVRVSVYTEGAGPSPGEVIVLQWDTRQRLLRSFKIWGLLWLVSIPVLFIPVVHFVALLILLSAPVVAHFVFRQKSLVHGGKATCPKCGIVSNLARSKNEWPLWRVCDGCSKFLRIEK